MFFWGGGVVTSFFPRPHARGGSSTCGWYAKKKKTIAFLHCPPIHQGKHFIAVARNSMGGGGARGMILILTTSTPSPHPQQRLGQCDKTPSTVIVLSWVLMLVPPGAGVVWIFFPAASHPFLAVENMRGLFVKNMCNRLWCSRLDRDPLVLERHPSPKKRAALEGRGTTRDQRKRPCDMLFSVPYHIPPHSIVAIAPPTPCPRRGRQPRLYT